MFKVKTFFATPIVVQRMSDQHNFFMDDDIEAFIRKNAAAVIDLKVTSTMMDDQRVLLTYVLTYEAKTNNTPDN